MAALAVCLLALLIAAIAGAARAQVPDDPSKIANDPGSNCPQQVSQQASCDTEYTPVAKETSLWTRVAGADFDQGDHTVGSPTPFSVDFFGVSFRNLFNGFFGGARCEDENASWDTLGTCKRVPTIYRYSQEAGQEGHIDESYTGSGEGYVAAIAWLGPDEALAVGGDGVYPRRDPDVIDPKVSADDPTSPSVSPAGTDPAGKARAWLYRNGAWQEITDELPHGMSALTALDVAPDPEKDCGQGVTECAFVGGLRQIWKWEDGHFTQEFTPSSTDNIGNPTVTHGSDWLFRVRQIRFSSQDSGPAAAAVTSGCCDPNPANNVGRVLVYDASKGRWDVRLLYAGRPGATAHGETLDNSYYAFTFAAEPPNQISVLASPGGTESADEPAPRIIGPVPLDDARFNPDPNRPTDTVTDLVIRYGLGAATYGSFGATDIALGSSNGNSYIPYELANPRISSTRLMAGDGDVDHGPISVAGVPRSAGDGIMDWAVGVLRSTGQGIAYTTAARAWGLDPPVPLKCPGGSLAPSPECQPDVQGAQDKAVSRALLAIPTYGLNGFALDAEQGVGWAVGDRGAIVRLGGEGTVGSATPAPDPPAIGSPQRTTPPASQPYDGARPAAQGSGPAGPVPALAAQPTHKLESPGFLASGSPDTRDADNVVLGGSGEAIQDVVMSRDGSEGWGLGPNVGRVEGGSRMTLYHYTGDRWQRCRVESVPGVVEPDQACAELAPLAKAGVRITAAARVPLERDSDPTNDDEFEVVAAGTQYADRQHPGPGGGVTPDVLLRYRDGHWAIDWGAWDGISDFSRVPNQPISDIAFVSPSDGWLITDQASNSMGLYHFGAGGWVDCHPPIDSPPQECGGGTGLIPFEGEFDPAPTHLALAGQRLYMYGTRQLGTDMTSSGGLSPQHFPFILYKDPGGTWRADHGGYDPGNTQNPDLTKQGLLYSLSAVQLPDGAYAGWAVGRPDNAPGSPGSDHSAQLSHGVATFLRLAPADESWGPVAGTQLGRIAEYLPPDLGDHPQVLSFLDSSGNERGALALNRNGVGSGPLLTYDGAQWKVLSTPFTMVGRGTALNINTGAGGTAPFQGNVLALGADEQGGFWMAARSSFSQASSTYLYRWSDRAPESVFQDVAHPIREPITSAAAGPDGRVWVTTESDRLYTYDRVTGWDSLRIAGWDRGRVVTRTSHANAVAVGADGSAVVAGENGRIAAIDPGAGVTLDPAVRLTCGDATCSTTQNLDAAAVAPDGSALVGGDRRALAWRSGSGEEFHSVTPPTAALSARLTGISMPSSDSAWVTTSTGQIYHGTLEGTDWSWDRQPESLTQDGEALTKNLAGKCCLSLNAISVDSDGHGYAVGDDGIILERGGGGAVPWHRVDAGYLDDFDSLFYQPGGGTLIGGESGLILTRNGNSYEVAHSADFYDPFSTGTGEISTARTVAVTAAPAPGGGVEAWAFSQASDANLSRSPAPGEVLHYSSDQSDPLSTPQKRVDPLPDSPAPGPDDLTVATFGKSDCQLRSDTGATCPEPTGSNLTNEVIADKVRDDILARSKQPGGPQLALFTGDVDQYGGSGNQKNTLNSPIDPSVVHHRWVDLVGQPFAAAGLPLFGAVGAQDLSHTQVCLTQIPVAGGLVPCTSTAQARAGTNVGWREALAGMSAPWGRGGADGTEIPVEDPSGAVEKATGGAHTHYAFDVERDGHKVARVAVVDSSLRSLDAADPIQNPVEPHGQLVWLSDVLCKAPGTTRTGEPCTREADEKAIVVTNTPTYSYGPGALSETAVDSTALETVLMSNDVNLVVSGRLGWNAVYWDLTPGLHCPKAGDQARDPNVTPTDTSCAAPPTGSPADDQVSGAQKTLGETIGGTGATGGTLLNVIAASAGGKFGPTGTDSGSAADGFWHGYTIVHLNTETGQSTVEQRPVLDWVGISGTTHVLRAGQKMALKGFGREPVGMDQPARYDDIASPSITHRFDLLVADQEQPWLAVKASDASDPERAAASQDSLGDQNRCAPYLCLAGSVGTLSDPQKGNVKAGGGNYPRTFAIAALSVGNKSATYPIVFEPRSGFTRQRPTPTVPVPVAPPPPAAAPPPTNTPQVNLPAAPVVPVLAAQAPPPPPAPPAPPTFASEAPMDISITPTALDVSPPTAVSQPPTPPVNPAPPSGARREARQRQAAAQKSGADSSEGSEEVQEGGGDLADSPNATGTAMTRHDFSAVADRGQPSAWTRDLMLGGGLGVAALILAMGLRTARPTPRRRQPEVPAPAFARQRRRR